MSQYLAKINAGQFVIDNEEEARHLCQVMRAVIGDKVKLFDGMGGKFEGEIVVAYKKTIEGKVVSTLPVRAQKRRLTLCFAPLSRAAVEEMLDKCTQTGVFAFQPVITERTEHDVLKKWDSKLERWNAIILAAVKQCECAFVPQIYAPIKFSEALQKYPSGFFAYEKEERAQALPSGGEDTAVFIGPVGGFTEDEARAAASAGLKTITLGANIMRAETAAIAASVLLLQ